MKKLTPTVYEKESARRIRQLIEERCDGSQQEFANKVGIGKASVSQYVNETNFPNNKTCGKIAAAFNVSPMWVMGFDDPHTAYVHINHMTTREDDLELERLEKENTYRNYTIVPTDGHSTAYYLNHETAEIAQKVFDDPNYRILFDAAQDAKPEDLLMAAEMLRRFKEARNE